MATAAELSMPVFILAGFFTRFAALALLVMTLVIEIFVYPNAFDTHGVWAAALLYLIKYGPGVVSLDNFVSALRGNFPNEKQFFNSLRSRSLDPAGACGAFARLLAHCLQVLSSRRNRDGRSREG